MNIESKRKLISEGNAVFDRYNKKDSHSSQPSALVDIEINTKLIHDLQTLAKKIPSTVTFTSIEDIYLFELKNLSESTVAFLQDELSTEIATPEKIMARYNVKKEDLEESMNWILENKDEIIFANKKQYQKQNEKLSNIRPGMVGIIDEAQDLLLKNIDALKKVAKGLFEEKGFPISFFDSYKIIPDIENNRSYSNRIAQICAISALDNTAISFGKIKLLWNVFLTDFGHEVLGHGLNYYLSDNSNLPSFIKWGPFVITSGIRESVASYMEKTFYKFLVKNSEKISSEFKEINLKEVLTDIAEENLIMEFKNKRLTLGFWVMANSSKDKQQDQIKELLKFSIEPSWPALFLNRNRNEWDRVTGLLLPQKVSELKYSVMNVEKAERKFGKKPNFVNNILTGFWTPKGFDAWVKYSFSKKPN